MVGPAETISNRLMWCRLIDGAEPAELVVEPELCDEFREYLIALGHSQNFHAGRPIVSPSDIANLMVGPVYCGAVRLLPDRRE